MNTVFGFIEYHSTCFGRSFRPSSGVQDCTHGSRCMSYKLVDCLLAGTRWNCPLAWVYLFWDLFLFFRVCSWILVVVFTLVSVEFDYFEGGCCCFFGFS